MIDLHDSHGRHIANFVSGQLHDVQGRNIGHYLENEGIFINMQGYYLGEIVDKRRLCKFGWKRDNAMHCKKS